ncbi:MAG: hypothetical protein HW400_814 [Candidatus Levybacteria bacterium]|nr:hypothetical protein [Candidatus Levybacteria bacterium]
MDPQKLSQLDPKLREAYQRVMGTTIPTPPATPATPAQNQTPSPAAEPTTPPPPQIQPEPIPTPDIEPPIQPEPFSIPQPAIDPNPQPIPAGGQTSDPAVPAQPNSNFVQMNSEVPTAPSQNFASGIMMPILFGIVGLIFLVIYTFFWTKIFNFKLPFLP